MLRKKKNRLYSLRAFSQNIGLSPAYISLIFNKKRHPSLGTAALIAKRLKWNRNKQKYFLNLLEFENPQTEESKEFAINRLQEIESSNLQFSSLEVDTFTVISEWYYSAILSLLSLKGNKVTIGAISKKLHLNNFEARNALRRLQRLGLVRSEDNFWFATNEYLRVNSTPSTAIRRYHKQILTKASIAIDEQPFAQRDFSNITLAIDPSKIQIAKKKIIKFQTEMALLLEGQEPTEVYQLSIQLFSLSPLSEKS